MKPFLRLLAVALPLLLTACAPQLVRNQGDASLMAQQNAREQQLAGVDHWTLQGHLGVTDGHDGGSGTLTWTQSGDRYDFVLRAPITGKSFRLRGGADGALLEGVEGGPLTGPDAEALMQRALGWDVPLADLRAWVLGARAAHSAADISFGANRLPSQLTQNGWTVSYLTWDSSRPTPLPTKVFAEKPPYKVRLVIDTWTLP